MKKDRNIFALVDQGDRQYSLQSPGLQCQKTLHILALDQPGNVSTYFTQTRLTLSKNFTGRAEMRIIRICAWLRCIAAENSLIYPIV